LLGDSIADPLTHCGLVDGVMPSNTNADRHVGPFDSRGQQPPQDDRQ
jgi:hypothetical protein